MKRVHPTSLHLRPRQWELWAGLMPGLYMALIGIGGLVWLACAGA
ncbi:MAG: hypothetical protein QM757_23990 [Paludibaculum sp.]